MYVALFKYHHVKVFKKSNILYMDNSYILLIHFNSLRHIVTNNILT